MGAILTTKRNRKATIDVGKEMTYVSFQDSIDQLEQNQEAIERGSNLGDPIEHEKEFTHFLFQDSIENESEQKLEENEMEQEIPVSFCPIPIVETETMSIDVKCGILKFPAYAGKSNKRILYDWSSINEWYTKNGFPESCDICKAFPNIFSIDAWKPKECCEHSKARARVPLELYKKMKTMKSSLETHLKYRESLFSSHAKLWMENAKRIFLCESEIRLIEMIAEPDVSHSESHGKWHVYQVLKGFLSFELHKMKLFDDLCIKKLNLIESLTDSEFEKISLIFQIWDNQFAGRIKEVFQFE